MSLSWLEQENDEHAWQHGGQRITIQRGKLSKADVTYSGV
jgi:hypothetical protein